MFGKKEVSDSELSRTVNSRLGRTGTGSRVTAVVNRGVVTLTGKLQYAAQRTPIMNAASRVAGIRQVIDQMQLIPAKKYSSPPPKPVVKPVRQIPTVGQVELIPIAEKADPILLVEQPKEVSPPDVSAAK
ncbi:MAG TPA: BON domain-containing protein [Pirellulales bacterium]|nr:BON domain-containing protein [Pirellulales bacterium]